MVGKICDEDRESAPIRGYWKKVESKPLISGAPARICGMTQYPQPVDVKDRPEECEVGETVLPGSVPHWDARIRLVEFTPANLKPGGRPWMFAASYQGMDVLGWKRVE